MENNVILQLIERSTLTRQGCWEWQGAKNNHGYGNKKIGNKTYKTHRLMAEYYFGIPEGKVVLHTCDNKICIRPNHLKVGTHAENSQDWANKGFHYNVKKTHCAKGHEYTPENTYLAPRKVGRPFRVCRACRNAMAKARYHANK